MGRPGCGNQVEIDDPCLAERHARIVCDSQGRWHLEALPSKNGVWVQVSAIRLTAVCRFQVGEQRFLFTI
jgi:pSer/pThr/pTyr-binding forkhead associated (FHA) protein